MHPSSNIWRTIVIGCEAKYELTKKRFSEGISGGEIEVKNGPTVLMLSTVFKISDSRERQK